MLVFATTLIVITLVLVVLAVSCISQLSSQLSQLKPKALPAENDDNLLESVKKYDKDRDLRLAHYLARSYVLARIDHQIRRMRVAAEVAEEPKQDNEQMGILEAYWRRELFPRLEEVIRVGQLSMAIPDLLYAEAKELLEARRYSLEPPPMPASYDEARTLFDEKVERHKVDGSGALDICGAAYSEAVDLAYWAAVEYFKENSSSSPDWEQSGDWEPGSFADFDERVKEIQDH